MILGRVTFRGKPIKDLKKTESCRYLGFWGTANGDMTVTKERVKEKARDARDMLKHHPLTPELELELFMSIGIGDNMVYSGLGSQQRWCNGRGRN
jgi:hypothetical protein